MKPLNNTQKAVPAIVATAIFGIAASLYANPPTMEDIANSVLVQAHMQLLGAVAIHVEFGHNLLELSSMQRECSERGWDSESCKLKPRP